MDEQIKERQFLNACIEAFEEYKESIFDDIKREKAYEIAKKFYKDLKLICSTYYKGELIPFSYRYLMRDVLLFEKIFLPIEYLFDFPKYDFAKILDKPISIKNPEIILDYIVNQARNLLFDDISFDRSFSDFESYDLIETCKKSVELVKAIAKDIGLLAQTKKLGPCFDIALGLRDGGNHYFTLIKINSKTYLIDITYSQFFVKKRCDFERLGIPILGAVAPGSFMQHENSQIDFAKSLLERGWIEWNEETQKLYFDGFLLSYRNGLYYERTNDFSFTATYSANDYYNFLYGLDNIYNYEREEELWFQKRSLDNPLMRVQYKSH